MSEIGPFGEDILHEARKDPERSKEMVDYFAAGYVADLLRLKAGHVTMDQLATRLAREKVRRIEDGILDNMTGLHNRVYTLEYLSGLLKKNEHVPLAFMDVDNFKQFNTDYGHAGGDAVLVNFCHLADEQLRPADLFGRYGGEEFIIAMPGLSMGEAVEKMAVIGRKVKTDLRTMAKIPGTGEITISAGLVYSQSGQSTQEIVEMADSLEKKAKREGKNQLRYIVDGTELAHKF